MSGSIHLSSLQGPQAAKRHCSRGCINPCNILMGGLSIDRSTERTRTDSRTMADVLSAAGRATAATARRTTRRREDAMPVRARVCGLGLGGWVFAGVQRDDRFGHPSLRRDLIDDALWAHARLNAQPLPLLKQARTSRCKQGIRSTGSLPSSVDVVSHVHLSRASFLGVGQTP